LDETEYTAEAHLDFFEYVLSVFGKTVGDVICLVGDNCNVNKALADLMGVPLVGCAAHRLNLAIQEYLSSHQETLLSKVFPNFYSKFYSSIP
jgi:hypothetical protein